MRVEKVKEDLVDARRYAYKIFGLLENGKWSFVCSEHISLRLDSEDGVRKHFERAKHHNPRYN